MSRDPILKDVLDEVSPSDDERGALREAYENVRDRALEALEETGVDGEVTLVGSTARDTWLSGDRDIDVFLLLPTQLDRESFETVGLDVGRAVFPDGTVEYAEHPYVQGDESGYDVDIVPCYDLGSTDELRSAVDRTPFHNEYVRGIADEHANFGDEVRLLKAFGRGAGVYGSDLRTRGLSGYLCELLVHRYGGFEQVVEAVADWSPPVRIEPREPTSDDLAGPLIVVDPVDPSRNVASVVTDDSFARLIDASRRWLGSPDRSLFFPEDPEPIDAESLRRTVEERGTRTVAVVFDAPGIVDDQLYPQLRKTQTSLVDELERLGFDILRSEIFADRNAVILVEANVGEQSNVEKHPGPPVHVREHASEFVRKYDDADVVGPYIEDGRYVVERQREHTTVDGFVRSDDFLEIGTGKHVGEEIRNGYDVLVNGDCTELLDEFGAWFAEYFDPKLP
ncbi:CCA tRNA nucleotidyltransferase [Haladaptatus sp. F3-133]|uniref:CCA-adding enzyme n=1 Tax=Halorutilus salinus TaxID=2487751 RepID=A0A9Q4C590_9EURY|nr:CCA tRNA nucleotidyltransferase [Halorutilus salinus]MCX2819508.1 CCA tRNA nucleotidyltransferase [Halorutilus salinus]